VKGGVMFLVDDIVLAPFRGIFWIMQEINNAAAQELGDESDAMTAQLSDLYMMLETGAITEREFEAQEADILHRLDQLDRRKSSGPGARRHERS
jgi:hypothetical protein